MYRRILVPIAAGEGEDRAVMHAISLASSMNASLRFVHIIEEEMSQLFDVSGIDLVADETQEAQESNAYLEAAAREAQQAGVAAETAIVTSEGTTASAAIVAEAERWEADVIVMNTRDRNRLAESLFGSVDKEVTRQARVPVLLVHE